MAEYIEKDIMLAKFIEGDGDDDFTTGYNFAVNEYRDKLKAMPAAKVQFVKHGFWHRRNDIFYKYCSVCNTKTDIAVAETAKFCPNCGADLRGEDNG